MTPLLEQHQEALSALCRAFQVQWLDVFGSAASEDFDPDTSDLDFVVAFADKTPGTYADRYLGFAEALERLFQRRVDLVTERSIRNPYFRRSVEATHQSVYDARGEKAPV